MKICSEDVDIMKKKCVRMYYCRHFSLALNLFIFLRQKLKKKIKKKKEKRETHVQAKCTPYQSTKDHGYIKMST